MYDAKLKDFTHLVGNNDVPSDKVLMALKDALAEPDRQLGDIDAQIHELRQQRIKIEQLVAPYRRILSPMRLIPSDILITIFRHCLATHRNPTMATSEAPMLLTRVCSRWRTLALASPRLWARIHIQYQMAKIYPSLRGSRHPEMLLETMSLLLQTGRKAIHEWLLRSCDCPLSISIYFGTDYDSSIRYDYYRSALHLLETIFHFSSRWKSLELNAPLEVYAKLESLVTNSRAALSNLVQVRLAVNGNTGLPLNIESIGILKSPFLKRISLDFAYVSQASFLNIFDVKSLPWSNVTHFSNHTCIDINIMFIILKHCSRLIHASFVLEDGKNVDLQETIHLPSLASLFITATSQYYSVVDELYSRIRAPEIRWIRQRYTPSRLRRRLVIYHHKVPSILPLVENSVAGIRILELDRFNFPAAILRRMMEAPSTANFLHTLCLHFTHPRLLVADPVETFDLNDLIVRKRAEGNDVPLALLPRLENFELYDTKVSDETVLEFITSRMDPSSPVCVLKKVKIVFYRFQDTSEMDLEEEVCKRAAAAGVEIDLTIQYLGEDLKKTHLNPLSPSVIGNGVGKDASEDCRSWTYEDLTQQFADEDD